MRKSTRGHAGDVPASQPETAIELTLEDVRTLASLAHFYERSLGPMRYLVRLTARRAIKAKYSFVVEESAWLERFASAMVGDLMAGGEGRGCARLTPRTLIAFWGRLLASLHSPRSRRRLSRQEIEAREALASKFQSGAQRLYGSHPRVVEQEISTRRPIEAQWMREKLVDR